MVRLVKLSLVALLALACGGDTHGPAMSHDGGPEQDAADHPSSPRDGAVVEPADASDPTTDASTDADATAGASGGASGASGSPPPAEQPTPTVCATVHAESETVTPEVLIVLDRSGSMTEGERWLPSAAAVRELTMQLETEVRFGLALFPDPANVPQDLVAELQACLTAPDPTACLNEVTGTIEPCVRGVTVAPAALDNAATIAAALDAQTPAGGTPTGETLQALVDTFAAPSVQPPGEAVAKIVLLITDGQPTCPNGRSSETTQPDIDLANSAIEALAARGVKTYVLGYDTAGPGNEMLASVLDGFAQRGSTGDTVHRSVSDQPTLLAELRAATVRAAPCSIVLESAPARPDLVVVRLDDVELPADDPDGWMLVGDRTVHLTGAACATLAQGAAHAFDVDVHCE